MAPTRTQKSTTKPHKSQPKASGSTPGVSKIKASLRQTQRLLAKDNLTADVRVTTERRLKGLEAELAEAELNRKEKVLGARYHGVKFFERQKVTRKIKQAKKSHDSAEASSKSKHANALLDARVDLNYILHYPKTRKYISLFPPEVRNSDSTPKPTAVQTSETDAQREEIRTSIRQQMLAGALPAEPELELEISDGAKSKRKPATAPAMSTKSKAASKTFEEVEDDEFFDNDDDDDE